MQNRSSVARLSRVAAAEQPGILLVRVRVTGVRLYSARRKKAGAESESSRLGWLANERGLAGC